jgi:hypothetical protein
LEVSPTSMAKFDPGLDQIDIVAPLWFEGLDCKEDI